MAMAAMGCDRRAGTSMLARRLTTILPAMTLAEAIETTGIHCMAGLTGRHPAVAPTRPFRAPHHTIANIGVLYYAGVME
jgi:magnesium chelatase family protein